MSDTEHHRSFFTKHRSVITSTAVVLVLVVVVIAAFVLTRNLGHVDVAADPASSSAASSAAPSPSPKPSTPAPSASVPPKTTATGEVVTVTAPGRWVVDFDKNLRLTVVTTPSTKFAKNKQPDDVKKGTTITVVGTLAAGVITATNVTLGGKKKN